MHTLPSANYCAKARPPPRPGLVTRAALPSIEGATQNLWRGVAPPYFPRSPDSLPMSKGVECVDRHLRFGSLKWE